MKDVTSTEIVLLAAVLILLFLVALVWRSRRKLAGRMATLDMNFEAHKRAADTSDLALRSEVSNLKERYGAVIDAEAEATALTSRAKAEVAELDAVTSRLRSEYVQKRQVFEDLAAKVAVFDETLAFAELGLYKPHFDYTDSEAFKAAILRVKEDQKRMVSGGRAVVCLTSWTVNDDRRKGKSMSDRIEKMALRSFNNECDAAVANVRWNNAVSMERRIETAYNQINKLAEPMAVSIQPEFLASKLRELRLTHELREKLKQEKDERAEAARAAREEQKLLRDLELAEAEEAKFQRLLDLAKAEASRANGGQIEAFAEKIALLERDLAEARARAERAQAMAEKTRSGYVYIISNVGSFGPDLVKIGLTRRLDPLDRVRELGDASVPFLFDVHAIIYSDDAPAIERALHIEFESARVNVMNNRKEFFRVSLAQVEEALARVAPSASFFRDVEAQEFRETMALRSAALSVPTTATVDEFPAHI